MLIGVYPYSEGNGGLDDGLDRPKNYLESTRLKIALSACLTQLMLHRLDSGEMRQPHH